MSRRPAPIEAKRARLDEVLRAGIRQGRTPGSDTGVNVEEARLDALRRYVSFDRYVRFNTLEERTKTSFGELLHEGYTAIEIVAAMQHTLIEGVRRPENQSTLEEYAKKILGTLYDREYNLQRMRRELGVQAVVFFQALVPPWQLAPLGFTLAELREAGYSDVELAESLYARDMEDEA